MPCFFLSVCSAPLCAVRGHERDYADQGDEEPEQFHAWTKCESAYAQNETARRAAGRLSLSLDRFWCHQDLAADEVQQRDEHEERDARQQVGVRTGDERIRLRRLVDRLVQMRHPRDLLVEALH